VVKDTCGGAGGRSRVVSPGVAAYWAVIRPLAALQVPFAALLTRNFINSLPDELSVRGTAVGLGHERLWWCRWAIAGVALATGHRTLRPFWREDGRGFGHERLVAPVGGRAWPRRRVT
jgi:hypothetical protein